MKLSITIVYLRVGLMRCSNVITVGSLFLKYFITNDNNGVNTDVLPLPIIN